jgi:aminoglycoside/choline kinase family phosphotransferase
MASQNGPSSTLTPLTYSNISPILAEYLQRYGYREKMVIELAGTAGSRRVYWRLRPDDRREASFILLASPEDDLDFGRFLRITQFYRLLQWPVPRVFCIDDSLRQVLLEDLGDNRLFDHLQSRPEAGAEAYGKAVDLLVDVQTRCHALYRESPDIRSRNFDPTQLRWETTYFRDQYLLGVRGLKSTDLPAELDELFADLAERVDRHPKAIMHRDYQSQNLMVDEAGGLRVIDYQGSRLGSIYYDLASLLLDPYTGLNDTFIESRLREFHERSLSPLDFKSFCADFHAAGFQRVMQALGAYGFLSLVKKVEGFAQHIPAGEARLRWLCRRQPCTLSTVLLKLLPD